MVVYALLALKKQAAHHSTEFKEHDPIKIGIKKREDQKKMIISNDDDLLDDIDLSEFDDWSLDDFDD